MDSGKESYIQPLLNWLQEIHHQMMSDVVAAQRQAAETECDDEFRGCHFASEGSNNRTIINSLGRKISQNRSASRREPVNASKTKRRLDIGEVGIVALAGAQRRSGDEFPNN